MKLYIGNIDYSVSESELNDLFSKVGEVSSLNLIKDRYTGRSRGFAFAEYADIKSGNSAIKQFNGYEVAGSMLKVNEARERTDRSSNHRY